MIRPSSLIFGLALISVLVTGACASTSEGGSNTNWLDCATDDDCPGDMRCVERRCESTDAGVPSGLPETTSACWNFSTIPDLSACPTEVGWFEDGGAAPGAQRGPYSLVGTVTDILPGGYPCWPLEFTPGWALRVSGADRSLDLFGLPGDPPLPLLGQIVSVESSYALLGYPGSPQGLTTVRSSDGTLLYWTATDGSLATLRAVPELTLSDGGVLCAETGNCGSSEFHALQIASEGQTVTLEVGETGSLGDYVITLGNFATGTASGGSCADVVFGAITVSLVRAEVLTTPLLCGGAACSDTEYCATNPDGSCFEKNGASCQPRPSRDACPTECRGLCGCDGQFYCNDCLAHGAGVSVLGGSTDCVAPECFGGGLIDTEACNGTWPCRDEGYPFDYGVACVPVGQGAECECRLDGTTVSSITLSAVPGPPDYCGDVAVLDACGFPRGIHGHPWAP